MERKSPSNAKISPATRVVRETNRIFNPNYVPQIEGKGNPEDIILTTTEDGCTRQENTKTGQLILRDAKGTLLKGSILNPAGRGPGTKNMTSILRDAITQVGKGDPRKRQEKIVEKVIELAEEGDKDMVKLVWEYMDGKAIQRVDHTSDGEGIQPMSKEQLSKLDKMFVDEGKKVQVVDAVVHDERNAEKSAESLTEGTEAGDEAG